VLGFHKRFTQAEKFKRETKMKQFRVIIATDCQVLTGCMNVGYVTDRVRVNIYYEAYPENNFPLQILPLQLCSHYGALA
jgi:hypothetical protein